MISGTLEYTMCSLPYLSFENTDEGRERVLSLLKKYAGTDAEEPAPVDTLDGEAQKFLPASAYSIFQKINLENIHEAAFQKSNIQVLSSFSTFTFDLKNEIKAWRTTQRAEERKTANPKLHKIIGKGTPLEKEINILKYQWDTLEAFSTGRFADLDALFTYKIKLLLLLRWWSFNPETGYKKFTQLTTNN